MNKDTLNAAISEAERFVKLAKALRNAKTDVNGWSYPKESGAARRASMDLTRALADMRRSS